MSELIIREPKISDEETFIAAMQRSQNLHSPWVKSPQTKEEFEKYLQRSQLGNQKSFLVTDEVRNNKGLFFQIKCLNSFFAVKNFLYRI